MKKKRKINLCYHSYGPELNLDWGTKIQQGIRCRKKKNSLWGQRNFLFVFIYFLFKSRLNVSF